MSETKKSSSDLRYRDAFLSIEFRWPILSLDEVSRFKKLQGETYRNVFKRAKGRTGVFDSHEHFLRGFLRWAVRKKLVGPCEQSSDEVFDAFEWLMRSEFSGEYPTPGAPDYYRYSENEDDPDDCFWGEAAHLVLNPFWGA